jgi:hypothetical protein
LCMTEAPSLGLGSIFEPSVYTQASGSHMGVHGVVVGGVCELCGVGMVGMVGSGSRSGGGWVSRGVGQGSNAPGAYCERVRTGGRGCVVDWGVWWGGLAGAAVWSSQESRLMSMHWPSKCLRCSSRRVGAAVSPITKPIRASRMSAVGSCRRLLWSSRPGPGRPRCVRNL